MKTKSPQTAPKQPILGTEHQNMPNNEQHSPLGDKEGKITIAKQSITIDNKKVTLWGIEHLNSILDRIESDPTLTLSMICKEQGLNNSYLSKKLKPLKEERALIRDKLFGERLKSMMTDRLNQHVHLDGILHGQLADVRGELAQKKLSIARKEKLRKEEKDLVYRIGSNWIALSNTLKPLGVSVQGMTGTPKDNITTNILNIFIEGDKPVSDDRALEIAKEKSGKLSAYFKTKERLDGVEDAEVIDD